ncbi:MAG: FkbM family methyltransferase [Desulfomicrobium sp.]
MHIRIKNEYDSLVELVNRKALTKISKVSKIKTVDKYGNIFHFPNIQYNGNNINLDCRHGNIISSFLKKQYRLSRNHFTVIPNVGDIVLDCGGCFGDTAISFACDVTKNGKVYVFEPLPSYINIIKHNIIQNKMSDQIKICPYAVGKKTDNINTTLNEEDIELSPGFTTIEKMYRVPTISIDDFVEKEQIERINFIKMDIEGSELDALNGAQKTITEHKPKLAISLYHKIEDFIKIPHYISQKHPGYCFYLDHYTIHEEETVLYCA